MIAIRQTRFGGPGSDAASVGNCFAAAVASILELPLEYVEANTPLAVGPDRVNEAWIAGWDAFLARLNLHMLCLPYSEDDRSFYPGYAVLTIDSPGIAKWPDGSNGSHAVVWKDGGIVWNPSGSPLRIDEAKPIEITVFMVLDPSRPIGAPVPAPEHLHRENEELRAALVQARGFIDVAVRAWMPNEHANCAIDSGCAHGADEREIFEELDRQVEAINKALGSLTPGSEAPATRGRDDRRG